jgi:hypothetical protein
MPPGTFDPAGRGIQLSLAEPGNGEMRFWDFTARTIPIAPARVAAGCASGDGWKTSSVTHQYKNKSTALLANGCVPGTARGLSQIKLKDMRAKRGVVAFAAKARKADLPQITAGLRVTLVLGADAAAGAAGECGTHVFWPAQCVPSRGNSALRCAS